MCGEVAIIQRIEIKNFESHKHTVIEDFSETFNLICGDSNAGKTSIVRALRLAAYNDFDPRSIRVGATACEVIVTTDRGTVKVVRGKKNKNEWTVEREGKEPLVFNNIGTVILPEVAEVMGFSVVQMGDCTIRVNTMNQLESHFMLAELDGTKATGSVRAQVVDEISGLSGIETLIKDISLDQTRATKALNKLEKGVKELEGKMHDQEALDAEKKLLAEVNDLIQKAEQARSEAAERTKFVLGHKETTETLAGVQRALDELLDPSMAIEALKQAEKALNTACAAVECLGDVVETTEKLTKAEQGLASLRKTKAAQAQLAEVGELHKRFRETVDVLARYAEASDEADKVKAALRELPKTANAAKGIDEVQANLDKLKEMRKLSASVGEAIMAYANVREALEKADGEYEAATKDVTDILDEVELCPLSLEPLAAECLEKARSKL